MHFTHHCQDSPISTRYSPIQQFKLVIFKNPFMRSRAHILRHQKCLQYNGIHLCFNRDGADDFIRSSRGNYDNDTSHLMISTKLVCLCMNTL